MKMSVWLYILLVILQSLMVSFTASANDTSFEFVERASLGLRSLEASRVELVPAYRYTNDNIIGSGQTFRWKANVKVPVYVDCQASGNFSELVKKAVNTWDAILAPDLEYSGCKDVSALADGETPTEEGIFVIQDSSVVQKFCSVSSSGCTRYHFSFSDDEINFFYAIVGINDNKDFDRCYNFNGVLLSTIIHEIGHAMGYDHPFSHGEDETLSVMNYPPFSTLYPTKNDEDIAKEIYKNIRNISGEPLNIELEAIPLLPPTGYSGCHYKLNQWPYEEGPIFCINGGTYPYQVVGATLLSGYSNLLCYQFDRLSDIKIISDDGQELEFPAHTQKGDVNGDQKINIVDALYIARYSVSLNPGKNFSVLSADVNCDNSVNIIDALILARKVVGLATNDWCGD